MTSVPKAMEVVNAAKKKRGRVRNVTNGTVRTVVNSAIERI